MEVIYSAAHAEFPDTEPLGGGKAVADYLMRAWRANEPFALSLLSPKSLNLTLSKPLTQMRELEYARFCRQFERAATAEILRHDPRRCVVLSNDISEGPDFSLLGKRGYRIVIIFHVDVVEYFTKFYLRGLVKPETAVRFRRFSLLPDMLRLVFQKQYECIRHGARIVVPSAPMRDLILRCYPWCAAEKIVVLPWGNVSTSTVSVAAVYDRRSAIAQDDSALIERRYSIDDNEFVIMTLSRLSPEKGIERLLAALPGVETSGRRLRLFICGGAAYMKGRLYEKKLRELASRITNVRVEFTGHVTGDHKAALLRRADLFVSPSRHESYGLTIAEALAAGCHVISHNHYGAAGRIVDCSDPAMLATPISAMIATGRTRKAATASCPSPAAEQLAALLVATAENYGNL